MEREGHGVGVSPCPVVSDSGMAILIHVVKGVVLPNWSKERRIPISFLPSLSTTSSFSICTRRYE